jgi:2',3'-cyclic-nucleotide 2'-phosphodiesterase (5'-nucleotidase family)
MKRIFLVVSISLLTMLSLNSLIAKKIQVISFNDFHGSAAEDGSNPGMSKFASAVKKQMAIFPGSSILVSGGDNYQGSALSILTYGAPINDMMKELGVSASAVGNHEFDWGVKEISKWSKNGNFPFLAANITDKATGKPVEWAKPYTIITRDNVKVAFIGLTTLESAYKTAKKNVENLTFIDPAEALQKWIDYLNSGKNGVEKPDVIVALTHIAAYQDTKTGKITGKSLTEICNKVKGLDAVIAGHSHELVCGELNNIPVIEAYKYGRALGILTINLSDNNKLEKIIPSTVSVTKEIPNLPEDPQSKAIYEKYNLELKKVDKVIGVAENKFDHDNHYKGVSPLGEYVCKAMADQTDSQIAITNGGGLRCSIGPGNITISKIFELMPFDNYLVTMQLSGKDLKRVIEHGLFNPDPDTGDAQFYGVKVYYNRNAPYMNRIESMTLLDGTPIEMNKDYKVTTVDFLLNGGDEYDFKGAKDIKKTYISLRDLIIDQIKKDKDIKAEPVNYLINTAGEQKKAA